MLKKETNNKAKDYDRQIALHVVANNERKAVVELLLKESNSNAKKRSLSHLVKYKALDKDHDQNEKTTKARIRKGIAIDVESTSKIAVVEPLRVKLKGRVLKDKDDIATILLLLSNTLQVPNLNRSSDGVEQRS
jgi:uncharacterized protein (UPF0216 family)